MDRTAAANQAGVGESGGGRNTDLQDRGIDPVPPREDRHLRKRTDAGRSRIHRRRPRAADPDSDRRADPARQNRRETGESADARSLRLRSRWRDRPLGAGKSGEPGAPARSRASSRVRPQRRGGARRPRANSAGGRRAGVPSAGGRPGGTGRRRAARGPVPRNNRAVGRNKCGNGSGAERWNKAERSDVRADPRRGRTGRGADERNAVPAQRRRSGRHGSAERRRPRRLRSTTGRTAEPARPSSRNRAPNRGGQPTATEATRSTEASAGKQRIQHGQADDRQPETTDRITGRRPSRR